jgi:hypothetical protein
VKGAMFSNFSSPDWVRLSVGLLAAGLLASFARPISSRLGWDVSALFLMAFMSASLVLSNIGELLARERLSPTAKQRSARALGAAALVLGLLYLAFRSVLADGLELPQAVLDGAVLWTALLAVMIAARLTNAAKPSGEP